MNNTVIKLRDISKKRGQTEILNHLNMTVYQKDIYGFIGQNGAGKSTTMKIIMSLIKETQGQLELFDTLDNQINRSRIGAIIENPAFYPYMTAYENLKYYIQYKGIVEINSIEKVLKMVGLENARKKKYKNYSLGMKQRLGLALALINHPDLLILDEPLNGLDPQGIVELREILSHLNKKTLEQKLHTENFKVMDDHTIYLYDFVNESSQVATTLIQEGVILNKMNISNVSLENYYLSLIKGVESHV